MGVVGIILLVVFVIVCILLVAIVLLQNEDGNGLGGLLGGPSSTTFGSQSGNVLTKTTYVLVTLFFLTSFPTTSGIIAVVPIFEYLASGYIQRISPREVTFLIDLTR